MVKQRQQRNQALPAVLQPPKKKHCASTAPFVDITEWRTAMFTQASDQSLFEAAEVLASAPTRKETASASPWASTMCPMA